MRDMPLSATRCRALHRVLTAVLGGAAMVLGASTCLALEFAKHAADSETMNAVAVKGRIETGDAVALEAYISKLPTKKVPVVYLNSLGGSLEEAWCSGAFSTAQRAGRP